MLDVTYVDSKKRKFRVTLPDGEINPEHGLFIGPPFLDDLDLPEDVQIKLHNELFERGIITLQDAIKNRTAVEQAIRVALRLSVEKILGVYHG